MPVTLYDYITGEAWKFTDGVEFTFPDDPPVTIPAGGYLLVVKKPAAFSWRYPNVLVEKVLGPYDGKLNNAGEKLEIGMPGGVDLWPTAADSNGRSLTRCVLTDYSNDPDNWLAAPPSLDE